MAESHKDIYVDRWCVTNVKAIETKYAWIIEDFNLCMKNPVDLKSGTFTSLVPDKTAMTWQLQLNSKPKAENKDYLSVSLSRLDNLKDLKPTVKATFMIINSNQQVEHTVNAIDVSVTEKALEIPCFFKINSPLLKENQNLRIICCLKIGLNSVKVLSNEEDSIESDGNNDDPSQIIQDLQKLNGNQKLSDCILMCQSRQFYAQKAILAARSSTFLNMFKNQQNGTEEMMEVYEVSLSADILTELLRFIYTGQLHNFEKSAHDLLRAANMYALLSMKKLCEIHLGTKLCIDNAVEMLHLAVTCDAIQLKQQVIDFITVNAKNIVNSPNFKIIAEFPDDVREDIMRIFLHEVK